MVLLGPVARLWINLGGGTFADGSAALRSGTPPPAGVGLASGDVDGDQDLDVVVASDMGVPRVWSNLRRQVDSPYVPRAGIWEVDVYAASLVDQIAVPWLALGALQPPVSVPPWGTFGLDPTTIIPLGAVAVPASTGKTTLRVPFPAAAAGTAVYAQAGFLHGASPSTWRLSHTISDVLWR